MLKKCLRVFEELRMLGTKGAVRRLIFEFRRRSGLDVRMKRITPLDSDLYSRQINSVPHAPNDFHSWWLAHRTSLGFTEKEIAARLLPDIITDSKSLLARADSIVRGVFCSFRAYESDFGSPPNWYLNPENRTNWPRKHSSRLLLGENMNRYGDIKLTWEIGRFAWVSDLLRAYVYSDNTKYTDTLFLNLSNFAEQNPLYLGPHWTSEQEVSIRALMMIFIMEVLAHDKELTAERLQLIHSLLFFHAKYLERDLDYAEFSIRNNHLVHGALGLYAIGHVLSWCDGANDWCITGRRILEEATDEQWYEDGGYVQPSNNYQRSAWHGLLLALKIADKRGDRFLSKRIRDRVDASRRFFLAQIEPETGNLPNWGPNDGALIGIWTEATYPDFRPLLQSMSVAAGLPKPFDVGIWDEELLWLWGEKPLSEANGDISWQQVSQFPKAGIHVVRSTGSEFAVLRAGSVLSRYGQQADQLHVDIWHSGENIALDAGSYNYNKSLEVHNWFRGTSSHNTVILDDCDQMIPHRKFKYLRWVKARTELQHIKDVGECLVASHDGYSRLSGAWIHTRLLMRLDEKWVVVDRLWPSHKSAQSKLARLHWLLKDVEHERVAGTNIVKLALTSGPMWVGMCSNIENTGVNCLRASDKPLDGWHSRHYNVRMPALALNLSCSASSDIWFATVFSPQCELNGDALKFDIESNVLQVTQQQRLPLDVINDAPSKFS